MHCTHTLITAYRKMLTAWAFFYRMTHWRYKVINITSIYKTRPERSFSVISISYAQPIEQTPKPLGASTTVGLLLKGRFQLFDVWKHPTVMRNSKSQTRITQWTSDRMKFPEKNPEFQKLATKIPKYRKLHNASVLQSLLLNSIFTEYVQWTLTQSHEYCW